MARFLWGHNGKNRHKPYKIDKNGYILKYSPDHHFAVDGYVRQHRLVYEEYHKCCLLSFVVVHHKDGNRQNNDIKNLEPMTREKHNNHHHKKDVSSRICLFCGKNKTTTSKLKPHHTPVYKWYHYEDGFLCKRCYDRHKKRQRQGLQT